MSQAVRVEVAGPVWTVVIDRPGSRNAVDFGTAAALLEAFERFDADDAAAVAVLWGDGGTFCSGADLVAIAEGRPNRLEPGAPGPLGPTRTSLSKPVVAAIEGYAVAGGLELALWCDLRVAARDATLGVFCRRWGVPLIDGGTVRLPRVVGLGRALDLVLTGRAVGAEEALSMGLVNRVVEPGRARAEAESLAAQLAALPQACMRSDRASVYAASLGSVDEALWAEHVGGVGALEAGGVLGAAQFARGAGRHGR